MRSGPITSWNIDVETMETVKDIVFLESKSVTCWKAFHRNIGIKDLRI